MKECKYCRTIYEDSLSACPNCGGTKVITAQEKAEDAALYQKEIENRENAVAVVATKRKMLISVLVGIVVLIIAVIALASYNANKPLSNGMTKDEGEAILVEGIAFYNDGDYESAIECFAQLPSDSKQYNEAQSMLAKCEDEYSVTVVGKANKYAANDEYETALNLLNNAKELLPNNSIISEAQNTIFKEYKNIIFTNAFSEAEKFVAAGNYPAGIQAINGAIKQIGTDDDASAKLQTYMSTYKSIVIENADNALASTGYADAISIINEGLKILNGDNDLLNKIDEYKTYAPVCLSYDDAYAINKYLRTGITDNSWLTDNYGTTYTSERVICNKDSGLFEDVGTIQYYLSSQYRTLTGTIYIPDISKNVNVESILVKKPYVQIWGDGLLLYELTSLINKDKPVDFCIDISNVEFLEIQIYGSWYRGDGTGLIPMNCVADLAVAK